jgi:iron(III) transport system ATP-binding protein
VRSLLEAVGLTGLERRYPHELSGGQQQRVALARALAIDPRVVLLDEPFSALDAAMRANVRREVAAILKERGTTTVLVTHDQDEALSMADRVAVLRDGKIVAADRPEQLYRSPLDADLAGFLGEANLLPGTVEGHVAATALGRLVLQDSVVASWPGSDRHAVVLVRPEQLEVRSRSAAATGGGVLARVVDRAFFGHDAVLRVAPAGAAMDGGAPLLVRVTGPGAPAPGEEVLLTVRAPVMAWPAGGP